MDIFLAPVNSIPEEVILSRKFSDALQIWHNVNYYTLRRPMGSQVDSTKIW